MLTSISKELIDPISFEPVGAETMLTQHGHLLGTESIAWANKHHKDPLSNTEINTPLYPNIAIRNISKLLSDSKLT